MNKSLDFANWLLNILEERGWSQSDLSRKANMTPATISLILSGQRNPGNSFCTGIARALKLPPEEVFRRAGLLPPKTEYPLLNVINHLIQKLPPEDQAEIVEYTRMKVRLAEQKGTYCAPHNKEALDAP